MQLDLLQTESAPSTSSAEGSPARTSASQAKGPVLLASEADYGGSSPESLATFDPLTSSWRTSQHCLVEGMARFSETWPRSGSMRSGTAYRLPPLARLTGETDSGSLLPTPVASDSSVAGSRNTETSKAHAGVSLTDWARGDGGTGRMLPTPCASMPAGDPQKMLARREREKAKGQNGNGFGLNLAQWASIQSTAMLPTPGASDARNCADYSDRLRGHSPQLRHLGSGRLNPRFVEWMMGFQAGHTEFDASEMPSSRRSPKSSAAR